MHEEYFYKTDEEVYKRYDQNYYYVLIFLFLHYFGIKTMWWMMRQLI